MLSRTVNKFNSPSPQTKQLSPGELKLTLACQRVKSLARRLLPGHADPRINLAITLERAGRAGEALAAYKTALEVQPGSVVAVQGAAVIAVREGRQEPALAAWLEQIALAGESEPWRDWARRASLSRGR